MAKDKAAEAHADDAKPATKRFRVAAYDHRMIEVGAPVALELEATSESEACAKFVEHYFPVGFRTVKAVAV